MGSLPQIFLLANSAREMVAEVHADFGKGLQERRALLGVPPMKSSNRFEYQWKAAGRLLEESHALLAGLLQKFENTGRGPLEAGELVDQ